MQSTRVDVRRLVEREELCTWRTRHVYKKEKKQKGPVEPKKEEEEDKLETFFCRLHDFHKPAPVAPAFVLANRPLRVDYYIISSVNFIVPPVFPVPIGLVAVPSTDHSAISYVNLALPSVVNPVFFFFFVIIIRIQHNAIVKPWTPKGSLMSGA